MPTYLIPVVWQEYGTIQIEAASFKDACYKAVSEAGLPSGNYLDDSIELDLEGAKMSNRDVTESQITEVFDEIQERWKGYKP